MNILNKTIYLYNVSGNFSQFMTFTIFFKVKIKIF